MNNNNDDNNVADLQSDFKCFDSLLMQDQEHMPQIRYSCCVCICTAFVVVFYTCLLVSVFFIKYVNCLTQLSECYFSCTVLLSRIINYCMF